MATGYELQWVCYSWVENGIECTEVYNYETGEFTAEWHPVEEIE